ncbi:MAG: prolipoprotein diacylglyceryl transferase [Acidimicrobiales bacterium]|jgi:prolipoprotein diacylglyceryl transferase|nr:prolipoprotein diacylglyceryl transferase [Acidimicrobiales bacterium]MDP6697881.1 prolipoprotein diacylglyceryl transferase [Acidimicrobiales bacterium]|tara:strand:- start:389 stop:1243 length:855 start_codon:yes stop_codon:yes gene_type:complete
MMFTSLAVAAPLATLLGYIPSPSSGSVHVGPVQLRAYGLMIGLGVLAAVWVGQRRWVARGGDPDDISSIAMWAVPAGLIGSRVYHVATDWKRFTGRWGDVFAIWQGGLGIPGGLAAGVLVGVLVARRRDMSVPAMLDSLVPTLPIAQAIGRWGNWFNQEVFGGPTDLPWGLRIDEANRPTEYLTSTAFHPTFLYEGIWNLALAWFLIRVDRRGVLRPGYLIGLWVFGYGVGRLWMETIRVDAAFLVWGLRVNIWMSLVAIAVGGAVAVSGRVAAVAADPTSDLH